MSCIAPFRTACRDGRVNSVKPSVYLILGSAGSGRRKILADLIETGLGDDSRACVFLPASEAPLSGPVFPGARRWEWHDSSIHAPLADASGPFFFVTDGASNPIDQIEAFKAWLDAQGAELARVLCVVDCRLAEQHSALFGWFEACIHFSDVALLNHREGVANKWLSDFIQGFKSEFFPCHFIQVKKGGLPNPALVLDPTPRRLTQYFDEVEELPNIEIETDDEEDDEEEGEDDGLPQPEPYFVRNRSGRRAKELPDVREFLAKK